MRRLADVVVRWPWAVIGVWIAIAVALPLTFPSLNEMAQRQPLAILPSDESPACPSGTEAQAPSNEASARAEILRMAISSFSPVNWCRATGKQVPPGVWAEITRQRRCRGFPGCDKNHSLT